MNQRLINPLLLLLFACLLFLPCKAQIRSKKFKSELLVKVAEYEKTAAECERKNIEDQLKQSGKIMPKISGHCWDGCAKRIVLPHYPGQAKRLKISGRVKIETIVDENGKVVYAGIIEGNPFLGQAAERAAYLSLFMPKKDCNDTKIKFRWTIIYNFILS